MKTVLPAYMLGAGRGNNKTEQESKIRRFKWFFAVMALLASLPFDLHAQERRPDNTTAENESVALELAQWGMPVVTFFAQKEANVRDMGAEPNQILQRGCR